MFYCSGCSVTCMFEVQWVQCDLYVLSAVGVV